MAEKVKRVMLNLDPAMAAEVANLAAAEGVKPSEMYRALVREALSARTDSFYAPMVASASGIAAEWLAAEVRDLVETEGDRILAELARMLAAPQTASRLVPGGASRAAKGGDR